MNAYKLDYSELVTALQSSKKEKADELLKELTPRLVTYLKVVKDADENDAREAVQIALLHTYERVVQDKITDKKYIYKYLLTACSRAYARHMHGEKSYRVKIDDSFGGDATPAQQIENLLDEERQQALRSCLQQLPDEERSYISYIIKHPAVSTKALSKRFGLTESNVRVKKSRIIERLGYCVQQKLKE